MKCCGGNLLTRNEERVLALVAAGTPWSDVEGTRTMRASRLGTLRRLSRFRVVESSGGLWALTVYGRAYLAAQVAVA